MRRLALALVFLTRLPVRLPGQASAAELGASTASFPAVGALIGLVTAAVFALGLFLGLPGLAAAEDLVVASLAGLRVIDLAAQFQVSVMIHGN